MGTMLSILTVSKLLHALMKSIQVHVFKSPLWWLILTVNLTKFPITMETSFWYVVSDCLEEVHCEKTFHNSEWCYLSHGLGFQCNKKKKGELSRNCSLPPGYRHKEWLPPAPPTTRCLPQCTVFPNCKLK